VQPAPIRDADDQAAWLATVLKELVADRAHVVGVSVGGWLACNQAVRAPQEVASLSLLDPAFTFARLPIGAVLRTVPIALPIGRERAMRKFMSWVDGHQTAGIDDDPVAKVILAGMREFRTVLPAPAYFSDGELRSITQPALVIIAGRSVIHDPRRALARPRALIPGVQADLWPTATHSISGQFADEVNARILSFIERLDC
jgi:pimeloyl-ACP methyl ester carboxylesterase